MKHGLFCLIVLSAVAPLYGQQIGDTVIVVAPIEAKLKMEAREAGAVPRGAALEVRGVGKSGFRVHCRGVSGWIARQDVLSSAEAVRFFTDAIKKKPQARDYYGRGNARFVTAAYREAVADHTKAIMMGLKDADAYCARGEAFLYSGKTMRAIADYAEAIRLEPRHAEAFILRGNAWYYKNEYDKAIADYTEAIRLDPKNDQFFCWRGSAWVRKKRYDKAILDYDEAIRLDPDSAVAYLNRGIAHDNMGDLARAIADYSEAIQKDPKCGEAYYNRGRKRQEQAIADYARAVEVNPKCAKAYSSRGYIWSCKGDYEKAITDYSEAVRLNAANPDIYANRAYAYYQIGDYRRSVADYSEVIRRKPDCADAYFNRGCVRHAQGDYRRAVADYTKAIGLGAKNVETYIARGDACYEKGDYDRAIDDYTAAIALSPRSPCLYETRAKSLITRGDLDRAVADLQRAIQLNPKDRAAKFEPWRKNGLSADSLRHGERQLRQMLKDRPAMAQHEKAAAPLRQWAIRKFAGEDLGEEIFWEPTDPPESPSEGCNQPPTDEEPGLITVRKIDNDGPNPGKEMSFDKAWAIVVFELYNITNSRDFDRLERDASVGRVSREQFAVRGAEIESRAAEKARSFYIHVFLPWASREHVDSDPEPWFLGARSDPEAPILHDIDKAGWYWRDREAAYDDCVARGKAASETTGATAKKSAKQAGDKREKPGGGGPRVAASGTKATGGRVTAPAALAGRIQPLDVLTVWASGTLLDQPVQGRFLVEPSGKLSLGPAYGRVEVKGLTIPEAEAPVKKQLEIVLKAPEVEVLAAGHADQWPGETPTIPFRIRPHELLKIQAVCVLLDAPINGEYRVDADGKVDLGEPYGSVVVKGLGLEEAERAIKKRLREMLARPEVSVTLTGWKRGPKDSAAR